MTDNKDNKGKNVDDLLEGFDEAFSDEIGQSLDISGDLSQYVDEGASGVEKTEFAERNSEKTEVNKKNEKTEVVKKNEKTEVVFEKEEPSSERTQVVFEKEESSDEKTQVVLGDSTDVQFGESTEAVQKPETERFGDISSLFEDESSGFEGVTEEPPAEATQNAKPAQSKTSDVRPLLPDSYSSKEGATETFEGKTEDLSSLIDSDLVSPQESSKVKNDFNLSGDLSSLIEEEISSENGKTEDVSSTMEEDPVPDFKKTISKGEAKLEGGKFPTPPEISKASKSIPVKEISKSSQSEESISFVKSEQSLSARVMGVSNKVKVIAGFVGAVLIAGGSFLVYKKIKNPAEMEVNSATGENVNGTGQVIESAELLKDLNEKYQKVHPQFLPDQFQAYSEAVNRLEDILKTFPNHKKSNSRLVEAILLKSDGYLDVESKNRVYQLLQKAEELDPNTVETLRAKARMLMFEGKLKDAAETVEKALVISANDFEAIQTKGEIFFANGELKNALDVFLKVQELQPESVRAKYFYYLVKEKMGALKEAAAGFTQLNSEGHDHPKSMIENFSVMMSGSNLAATRADLEKYLNENEKKLGLSEGGFGWKLVSKIALQQNDLVGATDALAKSVAKMSLDSGSNFQLGDLYFKQKDFQKASQYYTTAATLSPDNAQYLTQLGISLRLQGRLKESEEELRKVITKDPKNLEGLYQHSLTRFKLGYADEILETLKTSIKDNPGFTKGKILLGTVQIDKSDYKNALPNFTQALSESKDKETKIMALSALGNYYQKLEFWGKSKQYFSQANQLSLSDPEILFSLAKINIQLGEIGEAQGHLKQLQKMDPTSNDAKILQAGIFSKQGENDKAIEIYREVLKVKENDYETRILLAKALMEKTQYTVALEELVQAYKYNANNFYTYYYMGLANQGLGDLAEAERTLLKAVELMPNFYKTHYELEVTYLRKDDIKRGEEEMKTTLALEPSYVEAIVAMGDYYYGRSAYKEASDYYDQALKIQPNRADFLLKQAKSFHSAGDDKRAIKLFQKILQLKPTSASVYYDLGILFEENNDTAGAFRAYQKSIALAPNDPKPYYQLGFMYKEMGQNNKAISAFKTFLSLSKDPVEKPDIEDQIQRLSSQK